MNDFATEFVPGFAWLVVNRFAFVSINESQRPQMVGVNGHVTDAQMRTFPAAAQLAFLAVRDSLEEIRSKAGGTGMDDIYRLLETPVSLAVLLNGILKMEGRDVAE